MMRAPIDCGGRTLRTGAFQSQCSFCLEELAELTHLVAGPGVSICAECVSRCVDELRRRRVPGWRRFWDPRPPIAATDAGRAPYRSEDASCSFCTQARPHDTLCADHARICSPCVRLALDVIREQGEDA